MCATRLRSFALIAATAILISCGDESAFEPAARPTAPQLVGAPAEDVIPGQYIVVFRDDVRSPAAAAKEMAAAHGLKVRHTYTHTIRGFSAVVPEGRLAALQRHPLVEYVQPNRYLYIDTHERFRRAASAAQLSIMLAAPSGLGARALPGSEIGLEWTDNSDDEDGFEIARSAGAAGPFSKVASVKADVTVYVDGELSAGVEYCYKVRAVTGKGRNKQYSSYTGPVCETTLDGSSGDPPADPRPTELVAEGLPGEVYLTWTDNSDDETRYAIERCGPFLPGSACVSFNYVMFEGANATSHTDADVTANLQYCYRVRAMREKGKKITYTEYSNISCTEPKPLSEPEGGPEDLTATAISHRAIDLEWTDGATGESGFEIHRSGDDGETFEKIHTTGPGVTTYLDDDLLGDDLEPLPGHTYYYKVVAVNDIDAASDTATADATTLPLTGSCEDSGNHDDIDSQLWNIRRVKAHRNPIWQATRQPNCELTPWLFVLDTGVDGTHADLNVYQSHDFISGSGGGADGNGHGTHVAGTAAARDGEGDVVGVAPGAPIWAFKVCNDDGSCPADKVLAAVDSVTALKLDAATSGQGMVVNLSLGGPATEDYSLEEAILASVSAGVVYAISAGNGDLGACFFPADAQYFTPARVGDDAIDGSSETGVRLNGAIVTTASDLNDHDDNCNYGKPVTVAAPGVDILSTWPVALGGYETLGGASMATPHVAGAAILILQGNASASPDLVETLIWNELDDWTTTEIDDADGRLNVEDL